MVKSRKISTTYWVYDEDTDRNIHVTVDSHGRINITNHKSNKNFMFQNSSPDMVLTIAELLTRAAILGEKAEEEGQRNTERSILNDSKRRKTIS